MGKYSQGARQPNPFDFYTSKSTVLSIHINSNPDWLSEIHSLRYEVLRKPLGGSLASARFAGDESPTTLHVAGWNNGSIAVCASLFLAPEDRLSPLINSEIPMMQLRGMAVADECRGLGLGRELLKEIHRWSDERQIPLWCNAREIAIPFYEKLGWHVFGDLFNIPEVGLHKVMYRTRDF